jgi:hypothetical protein
VDPLTLLGGRLLDDTRCALREHVDLTAALVVLAGVEGHRHARVSRDPFKFLAEPERGVR